MGKEVADDGGLSRLQQGIRSRRIHEHDVMVVFDRESTEGSFIHIHITSKMQQMCDLQEK